MRMHSIDIQPSSAAHERNFRRAFLLFSGLTVLCGSAATIDTGVGPGLWLRNPAAWVVTVLLCAGLARLRMPSRWVLGAPLVVLALGFAGHGQAGVHRWIGAGPVQMHAAALVLPFALACAMRTWRAPDHAIVGAVMALSAGLLACQPDLSQLAALIAALLAWAIVRRSLRSLAWIVPVALISLFICARLPDPLSPVPYVEGIWLLAWQVSPLLALAGGVCLLLTGVSPLLLAGDAERRPAAIALAAYFLVSGYAWLFGAFPVPLAGYGLSFVLGWGIGAPALLMKERAA